MKQKKTYKENFVEFLKEYIKILILVLKVLGFFALAIIPAVLGIMVSYWFFIMIIFTIPAMLIILDRIAID